MTAPLASSRHVVVVGLVAVLPLIVAACGARVASEESGSAENAQSQAGATGTTTSTTGTTTVADAGPPLGTMQPGSGAYPCLSNTAAYYTDAGPPPPSGGCHDLYSPAERHAPGCVISIVAPTAPNGASCVTVQCLCGENGRWQPSESAACSW
jgi:hypothetical protein